MITYSSAQSITPEAIGKLQRADDDFKCGWPSKLKQMEEKWAFFLMIFVSNSIAQLWWWWPVELEQNWLTNKRKTVNLQEPGGVEQRESRTKQSPQTWAISVTQSRSILVNLCNTKITMLPACTVWKNKEIGHAMWFSNKAQKTLEKLKLTLSDKA